MMWNNGGLVLGRNKKGERELTSLLCRSLYVTLCLGLQVCVNVGHHLVFLKPMPNLSLYAVKYCLQGGPIAFIFAQNVRKVRFKRINIGIFCKCKVVVKNAVRIDIFVHGYIKN